MIDRAAVLLHFFPTFKESRRSFRAPTRVHTQRSDISISARQTCMTPCVWSGHAGKNIISFAKEDKSKTEFHPPARWRYAPIVYKALLEVRAFGQASTAFRASTTTSQLGSSNLGWKNVAVVLLLVHVYDGRQILSTRRDMSTNDPTSRPLCGSADTTYHARWTEQAILLVSKLSVTTQFYYKPPRLVT